MIAESAIRDRRGGQTLLVVADDPDILVLAQAVLKGKGYRVLVASGVHSAKRLLKARHIRIHSLAVHADMSGCEDIENWCLRRGAKPWFFCASVKDGIVQLKGLEPWMAASDARPRRELFRAVP